MALKAAMAMPRKLLVNCNLWCLQVVTKRTKNLKKQEIPSLDDPISKLNHIGKETVKKLNELAAAAAESEIDLRLPPDLHQCASQNPSPRLRSALLTIRACALPCAEHDAEQDM